MRTEVVTSMVLSLAAFQLPAFAAESDTSKPCALTMYDSITIVGGEYVPVTLDGHRGLMLLGLASGVSTLSENTVTALGLKRSPPEARADRHPRGATATITVRRPTLPVAKFNALQIGKINFGEGTFFVVSGDHRGAAPDGRPIFGMLGTDVLGVVDFELDLSRRKLNLFSQDHCAGQVVYWADEWGSAPLMTGAEGTIYFSLELEGRAVEAIFSPTAPFSWLRSDIAKRLYGFDEKSPGIQTVHSADGSQSVAYYRAMELTGHGMSVKNSRIELADSMKDCRVRIQRRESGAAGYDHCMFVYPMALGRNVLQELRLYFATKEKMLYFTRADATSMKNAPAADAASAP
jgi:hypothetical protein